MLENVSAIRQRNKIASDDLFGDGLKSDNTINWDISESQRTDLEVLLLEKESLGIYVSGNPLSEYKQIQNWVREFTYEDNVHLVVIDKIKKIFTKTNAMMFALALSTTAEPLEGIIFPKIAPNYSTVLEERQIFWIKGRVSKKKKKKQPEAVAPIENENGTVEDAGTEIKEYDELPKLIVDSLAPFVDGPLGLFDDLSALSINRIDLIERIDWKRLLHSPNDFEQLSNQQQVSSDQAHYQQPAPDTSATSKPKPAVVKLKKELGAETLKKIHKNIHRKPSDNVTEIELWVESGGEMKKVKGPLWIDPELIQNI